MTREAFRQLFTENIDRWMHVRYEDGETQYVYVLTVDEKGYTLRLNPPPDEGMYWTTFTDLESATPVSDEQMAELGLYAPL
jgi:hypothetical protein